VQPWGSDSQALAALGAPAAQDEAPAFRGHARAEPVGALAMQIAWLIRALHLRLRLARIVSRRVAGKSR